MEAKRKWEAVTCHRKFQSKARAILTLILLLVTTALLPAAVHAEAEAEQRTDVYLPVVSRARPRQQPLNCNVAGSSYGTLSISSSPTPRPVSENPDFNIRVRGWQASDGGLHLVDYGSSEDGKAPQLDVLFGDRRLPSFTSGWDVYGWDWERMRPIKKNRPWDVTLLGLATTPGEVIRTPDSGYDIGGGHDALVLYASPTQITLKYTREDHVVYGYTIHLEGICVEPDLLALYAQADAAGRYTLPAVRGGQPLGRAPKGEILVSIRDSGTFMDPRSHHDWWKTH